MDTRFEQSVRSGIGGFFGGFLFYMGTNNIWLSVFAALISISLLTISTNLEVMHNIKLRLESMHGDIITCRHYLEKIERQMWRV